MTNPESSAHSRARAKKSIAHQGHDSPQRPARAQAPRRAAATARELAPAPLTSVVIDGVRVELGDLPELVVLDMPRGRHSRRR